MPEDGRRAKFRRRQRSPGDRSQTVWVNTAGDRPSDPRLGGRAEDPCNSGLAALYEKRHPEATVELEKSFSIRKKAEAYAREKTATRLHFWDKSPYQQGRYR